MRLGFQFVLATFYHISLAQLTTSVLTSTATRTASAAAQTWTVSVGKADHAMRPETLMASVGDVVEFQFAPSNHSVVRAEYTYPCIPYEMTGRGKVGFFSGFKPVDAVLDAPPKWSITINDTNPIFYYCSAPGSCINYQMVGVINPNASTSLAIHKEAAKNSKYMLQPGDPFPVEGSTTLIPSGLSPTSPAATTSAAAAAAASHSSFPAGAIAGVVVGALLIIALAAALFFFVGRAKSLKETVNRQSIAPSMASLPFGKPGHMSPASPPPPPVPTMPTGPIDYNGTVYIPVKAADMHRTSLPAYGQMGDTQPSPMRSSGGSPGVTYVPVSTYEVGNHGPTPNRGDVVHQVTPVPAEMFAGSPKGS